MRKGVRPSLQRYRNRSKRFAELQVIGSFQPANCIFGVAQGKMWATKKPRFFWKRKRFQDLLHIPAQASGSKVTGSWPYEAIGQTLRLLTCGCCWEKNNFCCFWRNLFWWSPAKLPFELVTDLEFGRFAHYRVLPKIITDDYSQRSIIKLVFGVWNARVFL